MSRRYAGLVVIRRREMRLRIASAATSSRWAALGRRAHQVAQLDTGLTQPGARVVEPVAVQAGQQLAAVLLQGGRAVPDHAVVVTGSLRRRVLVQVDAEVHPGAGPGRASTAGGATSSESSSIS